jgi:hypothetical protein
MAKKLLTAAEILDNSVTEKELKHNVEETFRIFGYKFYHVFFSEYGEQGFPDEFALKGCRNIFIELKTMKGVVKPKQIEWLDVLSDNPHNECFVIRPNQMQLVIDIFGRPDPYKGPERWTRENHFGV